MGDFSIQDTIGQALAAWTATEKAKADARLIQSREQMIAYEQAARSSGQAGAGAAGDMSKLVGVAVIAGLALAVYLVVR